ncbi:GlxA family transcriptional regulator [Chryseobacterium arthrosphaerae]|uniref:GlxA family transcriptional regulator n=1 Tax=Chryseobacterium arthrosphaerae TaxID=651561 RepID=UPI001E436627|nr:helix-turn-helix domain-containing protein [Chryseobacterium arthrosphaerae]UEQ78151.1 helix-turn-helix domain-containing protein [Chryseobacterium arthrosphaerae]
MKHVTILIPTGNVNLSSVVGTLEILTGANEYWQKNGNNSRIKVSVAGVLAENTQKNGFYSFNSVDVATIKKHDLVIIPSIANSKGFANLITDNKVLIEWIKEQYKDGAEIASICTGAFLLAATGILDGKTCSTHWQAENDFRALFPNIELQTDKLLIVGQGLYTNGGAFSFLNLVLLLVEKYFDRQTAIYCSKVFQIDPGRNLQSPFAVFQPQKNHDDEVIIKAQNYVEQNLSEKISFEQLAFKLAVSRRNFDRRFIKATGVTPVEYMQRVKIEAAKSELERGRKSIFEIMDEVGYSDERAFRDLFKKKTGLSPTDYKLRFNKESAFL